ncbi:MAG: DUF305 domain-containing protein [Geminicoccaceae bacterium]
MRVLALVPVIGLLAVPAAAQETMHQHGSGADTMQGAMQQMQHGMDMPSSGDTDTDFARMMIPHHQGAIDMARTELANGKDPELRQLAEQIIAAQEKEIAFLKQWLATHGAP